MPDMQLRDFVSGTLTEITEGIIAAKTALKHTDVRINPFRVKGAAMTAGAGRVVEQVEFDVAVSTKMASGGKGTIGVFAAVLRVDGEARREGSRENANRIKFAVPVIWPVAPK